MTVNQLWESFLKAAYPPNISTEQRWEMRRCFYAGAMGALTEPVEDHQIRAELIEECGDFKRDVLEGRA